MTRHPTPEPPIALVGCLLDVSNSMRHVLESGKGDEQAIDRFRAVLRAALKLARAEQQQNPNALMFIGAFGVRGISKDSGNDLVVDLFGLVDALLAGVDNENVNLSGHELLISLANENNVAYISRYIKERLTDDEARIVYVYLQRHSEEISEFVDAIPSKEEIEEGEKLVKDAKSRSDLAGGVVANGVLSVGTGPLGAAFLVAGAAIALCGRLSADSARDKALDDSKALKLARRICEKWLVDFEELVPRPVDRVVPLLERLEDHPAFKKREKEKEEEKENKEEEEKGEEGKRTILDELEPHLYGWTPMRCALEKSLAVFRENNMVDQRVLVLISDGVSTDGDPRPLASQLKQEGVTIASIFLTDDSTLPRRLLHDTAPGNWPKEGQRTLFNIASTVSVVKHPIPVLASIGWTISSSGQCKLYATVHSASVLEEFCSILLSARFGSADVLLDLVGRVELDAFINNAQMGTRSNPSLQQGSTCYAHAAAAVLHMALIRIEGREGGYPSIEQIRSRILREFPPGPNGGDVLAVLTAATKWYCPLRIQKVTVDGAREAVILRRPVLATFRLSDNGWTPFSEHFMRDATRRTILSRAHMAPYRMDPPKGGHAVVLVQCDPNSLTFLNSWGNQWGDNGTFSIEDPTVLEVDGAPNWAKMCFYDIFFYEQDLKASEKQAFEDKVNQRIRDLADRHQAVLDFEAKCPHCKAMARISDFTGSIRKTSCPHCHMTFKPEAEHLVKALYARAGLRQAD